MALHALDWLIVAAYVVFALWVGMRYAKRAEKDVDEFFLSGRSLPWWIAGTSMVATSFAADTPLLIGGWIRDFGIWKNWVWWCYCGGGMLSVFLFARGWRRGGVMTKAELSELRYGGASASVLRGTLGVLHAGCTNTMVLCWVMLAASKIMEVLLGIDGTLGLVLGCIIAMTYSLLAGFWGVVITDMVQFVMAMAGSIALAWICWVAVGGSEAVLAAASAGGEFTDNTLRFFPKPGEGSVFDASFWTTPVAALAVYFGVSWWAAENVDGSGTTVQRIAASRNERDGVLSVMWFNVAHYALRPWPWILVGLASLIVLPTLEVHSPVGGEVVEVVEVGDDVIGPDGEKVIGPDGDVAKAKTDYVLVMTAAETRQRIDILHPENEEDWYVKPVVKEGKMIEAQALVGRTDSELAYVVMMRRYLPIGLLGLVVASLLAAFMSTIDTHVNLASSFFVNDIYRRFFKPEADARHYVNVARVASVVVLVMAASLAALTDSISDLFLFFLAFLSGVGPIYVLRWHWWRIRASTEITAMLASAFLATFLTLVEITWPAGPLTPGGALTPEGRLLLVVSFSSLCALLSIAIAPKPEPRELLKFYRAVRPAGWWGPVAVLAPEVAPARQGWLIFTGILGGLALVYGMMLAMGYFLLERTSEAGLCTGVAIVGGFALVKALGGTANNTQEDPAA